MSEREARGAMLPDLDDLIQAEMQLIEIADRDNLIEDVTKLTGYLASLAHAAYQRGLSDGVRGAGRAEGVGEVRNGMYKEL